MITIPQNPNPHPVSVENPIFLDGSDDMNQRYRENSLAMADLVLKEMKVQQQARIDGLTGIANREGFDERINEIVGKLSQQDEPKAAFIFIDLDNFKTVNDTHERKHEAGDDVLRAVADILQHTIGVREDEDETIGRLGGDEFGAVIQTGAGSNDKRHPDLTEAEVINGFKTRLQKGVADIAEAIGIKGLGVSIGVVEYQKGESTEEFRKRADAEMYKDKENKNSRRT